MLTLSENEVRILDFLVRNPLQKSSMRGIAIQLKVSPASVHTILKELEKQNILLSEKLGSGLFYTLNTDNKVTLYLAAFILAQSSQKYPKELERLHDITKIAILWGKALVCIDYNHKALINEVCKEKGYEEMMYTSDEFQSLLRKKDTAVTNIIREGYVIVGEYALVGLMHHA